MKSKLTPAQALRQLFEIIVDTCKDARDSMLGGIPNGHLWTALMGVVSFDTYMNVIQLLKRDGYIRESNHLLIWVRDLPPLAVCNVATPNLDALLEQTKIQ